MPKKIFYHIMLLGLLLCLFNKAVGQELPSKTENIILTKVAQGSYIHISTITLESGSKYPCNGFLYINKKEAYIFDSPANQKAIMELLDLLKNRNIIVKGVVFNHFHSDCTKGIEVYKSLNIPTIASTRTAEMMKKNSNLLPDITFQTLSELNLGSKKIINQFVGEAHSPDNIISYFANEHILFGGCMIKSIGAQKGNLSDANLDTWSDTVRQIKKLYPNVKIVIPGHGSYGDQSLLDYTISLFNTQN